MGNEDASSKHTNRPIITGLSIFLFILILSQAIAYQRYMLLKTNEKHTLENATASAKERLQTVLNQSIAVTQSLAYVIENKVETISFDTVAARLLRTNNYIDALQVAPNGVVLRTYPPQGHELAVGYNIMADTVKNTGAYKALESKQFFFAGPLELKQGGQAVIARQPIFMDGKFWGFSAAIVRLPSLMKAISADSSGLGKLKFRLSKIESGTNEEKVILSAANSYNSDVYETINVPGGEWRLYVTSKGNITFSTVFIFSLLGVALSLLGGMFAWYIVKQPETLNRQVEEKTAELKRSYDLLQAASEREAAILDALPANIALLDTSGTIVAVNQAWRDFGAANNLSCSNANIGDNYIAISENAGGDDAEVGKKVAEGIKQVISGKRKDFSLEYPCHSPIEKRWYQVRVNPSYEGHAQGAVVMHLNISENKKAQDKIKASEERYRLVSENPILGIAWISIEGRILNANATMCSMLKYTPMEILDMHYSEFTHPDDIERQTQLIDKVVSGEANGFRMEKRCITKNKEVMWSEFIMSSVRDKQGKVVYNIAMLQDVSAKKKVEQDLQFLNDSLERKVEDRTAELKVANQELEAFSYTVSHDLRAPLRSINGFATLLERKLDDVLDADSREYMQRIADNVSYMNNLIQDLLDFSRIGKAAMVKKEVDLDLLIQVVIAERAPEINAAGTTFSIQPLGTAVCDPVLIRQVWINLICNAIKYSSKKEKPEVHIGIQIIDGETVYYIKDNGAGFDMAQADRLFGVFKRLHTSDEFEGTGVGLASVHRIISRHGGLIWAEAQVNEGATFYFTLPQV